MFLFLLAALIPIAILLASGMFAPVPVGARLTLMVVALIMLTTAFVFSSLTITIRNGQLTWWFGPGLARKSVALSNVTTAEPTTTSAFNGLGIHPTSRGWLYNVAGREAVHVTLNDGTAFLLGTDEPNALASAIMSGVRAGR